MESDHTKHFKTSKSADLDVAEKKKKKKLKNPQELFKNGGGKEQKKKKPLQTGGK